MKDRIKFSDEMLAAVIDGRKTQTRRPVAGKTLYYFDVAAQAGECYPLGANEEIPFDAYHLDWCPYGKAGDVIPFADKDGNIKGEIEIVDVWLQRVQETTLGDICKEVGCGLYDFIPATYGLEVWEELWKSIYGEENWQANPWVWCITFKQVQEG